VETTQPLISIVDDDELLRGAVTDLIRSLGYRAAAFGSAEAFLRSRQLSRTACLIADINMPTMSGLELYRRLSSSGAVIPTILITAYPDDRIRKRALDAGVRCYIVKPFDESELLLCIDNALSRKVC
jgi:FixJ family two-component response regulator